MTTQQKIDRILGALRDKLELRTQHENRWFTIVGRAGNEDAWRVRCSTGLRSFSIRETMARAEIILTTQQVEEGADKTLIRVLAEPPKRQLSVAEVHRRLCAARGLSPTREMVSTS